MNTTTEWLGCPVNFTMMRREFSTDDVTKISSEVSEWLGCKEQFLIESFSEMKPGDTDTKKKRIFERHHQRHATVVVQST